MSLDVVLKHIELPWDWKQLSLELQKLSPDDIKKYPELPWNWDNLSYNYNLSSEFFTENSDKDFYWKYVASNHPDISIDFMRDNLDKDWPISMFIDKNYDKDYKKLYDELLIENSRKEHTKKFMDSIRWELLEVSMHPSRIKYLL